MRPAIGRTVHYALTRDDVDLIKRRRDTHPDRAVGNPVTEGDTYPAVIVRVWDDNSVNLRVWLDGTDDLWAPSRHHGTTDEPGTWAWPARV
ncbi:hypothetical protein [Streptomyces pini]|uniref:Uncharacterized protein n=1 Tax=Streptomyces pini TaxID=1520580 RepID=A0A1I4BYV7_9ACTN|nr:hypothetical protein [Streptomyces pini]SFK73580.1 hypothetical protein SAMN05192584_108181 [Streptomyces pini]